MLSHHQAEPDASKNFRILVARVAQLAFSVFLTGSAASAQTVSRSLPDGTKNWFEYLSGGALGAALGFLLKWLLEQWSARAAARREFAKEITRQISLLAEKHYWALANTAGLLAGQLEGYLAGRTYHLIIPWPERRFLRERLDDIATEAAEASFPHFCRLVWLFDAFQFQSSTTYLLTDPTAGDLCKRLYNMFVASLPEQLDLANIREFESETEEGDKVVRKKLRDLPSGTLTGQQIRDQLAKEKEAYTNWFKHNVPSVSMAAQVLRAYNELLNHELELLYRLWFKRRPPSPESYAFELGLWPNLLTQQAVATVGLAGYQSNLPRALGAAAGGKQTLPQSSKGTPSEETKSTTVPQEGRTASQDVTPPLKASPPDGSAGS